MKVGEYRARIQRYGGKRILADTARVREVGEEVALGDLVVAEARRRGYDRERAIIRGLAVKKAELLADKLFALQVADQAEVTRDSLRRFYQNHRENYRRHPEIHIQEILVDDPALADSLRNLILAGADMDALAREHTQRLWAREKGGRFGPLTERSLGYGDITRIARRARIGALQGPVLAAGGYSLFRVTGRGEEGVATFEEAEAVVRQDLLEREMDRFIKRLQHQYASRIRVDQEGLEATLRGMAE